MKDNRITTRERQRKEYYLSSSYTQRPHGQSTNVAFYTLVLIYTVVVNFEGSWPEFLVSKLCHQ
jgi:hypothetical protein